MADICVMDQWLMTKLHCPQASLPQAVAKRQLAEFQALLAYAALRSRFYQQRFAYTSLADLASVTHLPFMDASDLAPWQDLLCVSQDHIERLVTLETSGSSGPPKRLAFTLHDLEATMDFFRAGMSQLIQPHETLLVLLPGADRPFGVADLLRRALSPLSINVQPGNPLTSPETLARELSIHAPHAIVAAPRQWQHILSLPASLYPHLRGLLSSAEPLPSPLPSLPFLLLDHYGLTESCYGGGVECPCHNGYHLRALDLYLEIVDISTGAPLPPGPRGEIGRFQRADQPARQPRYELRAQTAQFGQRSIRGKHELPSRPHKRVDRVHQLDQRRLLAAEELHVVDQQQFDVANLATKVRRSGVANRVDELIRELLSREIDHASQILRRAGLSPNPFEQMRLARTWRPNNCQW